jgi:hypothetical protein
MQNVFVRGSGFFSTIVAKRKPTVFSEMHINHTSAQFKVPHFIRIDNSVLQFNEHNHFSLVTVLDFYLSSGTTGILKVWGGYYPPDPAEPD